MEAETLVKIENIGHVYGTGTSQRVRALGGVSFDVQRGEVLGLVGPNGAGKTTLARIVAGLESPTEGRVSFSGGKVPRVGMVFQQPENQFFASTCLGELAYGLQVEPDEVGDDALALAASLGFRREELASTSPFDLPPDKKRLLALTSFFILDWDVLILDEPLAGLGAAEAAAAADALFSAKGDEGTLIVISHDLTHLFSHLGRVVLLDRGRLAWEGRARELLVPEGASFGDLVELPEKVRLVRLFRGLFPEVSLEDADNEEFAQKIFELLKEED